MIPNKIPSHMMQAAPGGFQSEYKVDKPISPVEAALNALGASVEALEIKLGRLENRLDLVLSGAAPKGETKPGPQACAPSRMVEDIESIRGRAVNLDQLIDDLIDRLTI